MAQPGQWIRLAAPLNAESNLLGQAP